MQVTHADADVAHTHKSIHTHTKVFPVYNN